MTDQIVSREAIRAKARAAFQRGQSRDSHEMNWHSPALSTWLDEYDRMANMARLAANQQNLPLAISAEG